MRPCLILTCFNIVSILCYNSIWNSFYNNFAVPSQIFFLKEISAGRVILRLKQNYQTKYVHVNTTYFDSKFKDELFLNINIIFGTRRENGGNLIYMCSIMLCLYKLRMFWSLIQTENNFKIYICLGIYFKIQSGSKYTQIANNVMTFVTSWY